MVARGWRTGAGAALGRVGDARPGSLAAGSLCPGLVPPAHSPKALFWRKLPQAPSCPVLMCEPGLRQVAGLPPPPVWKPQPPEKSSPRSSLALACTRAQLEGVVHALCAWRGRTLRSS